MCSSNLRQLVVSLESYANDQADRYAPGAADALGNLNRWHGSRSSGAQAFSPAGGSLTEYISSPGDASHQASRLVRSCPSFAPTASLLAQRNIGFERSAGGYGYNNTFVGTERASVGADPATGATVWVVQSDRVGSQRHRFTSPQRTIAFADAAFADGNPVAGVIEYSFVEPRFWPENPSQRADPSIHFRHASASAPGRNGRANMAHLDGHVQSDQSAFSWSSGLFPADTKTLGVGWSGSADSNIQFEY